MPRSRTLTARSAVSVLVVASALAGCTTGGELTPPPQDRAASCAALRSATSFGGGAGVLAADEKTLTALKDARVEQGLQAVTDELISAYQKMVDARRAQPQGAEPAELPNYETLDEGIAAATRKLSAACP